MQPSFWDQIITELRLSLSTRRSELAVLAVALLMGSVFVTTRLLETPINTTGRAGTDAINRVSTPTATPAATRQNVTPAAFREGFGGLELSPLPTQPPLSVTSTTAPPTATPIVTPTTTVTPSPTPGNDSSGTPTPTPRTNPYAPYIP